MIVENARTRTRQKRALEKRTKRERSAVLVVNTYSRRGEHFFFAAMDELIKRGIWIAASYPVRDPRRLQEIMEEAIGRGESLVIVGGGDGTISSVVDHLAYEDLVLGILPLGTGNSFARTLGIPLDLPRAVDVILKGKVVDVDIGQAEENCFANSASIGFTTYVQRESPVELKRRLGMLAGVIIAMRAFLRHKPFQCTITTPQDTYTFMTHQVIIANGSHMGIKQIRPDANANNRRLMFYAMRTASRWRMLRVWLALFLGRDAGLPEVLTFEATEATVETDPPQPVDVDGEIRQETPVHFTLMPQALKVMAPQDTPD